MTNNQVSLKDFLIRGTSVLTNIRGRVRTEGEVVVVFGDRSRIKILEMTLGRYEPGRFEIRHLSRVREEDRWGENEYIWRPSDRYKVVSIDICEQYLLSRLTKPSILIHATEN